MADRELERRILETLGREDMLFRDLLRHVPEVSPLSVKLALDRLEKENQVTRFVRDGAQFFGLLREENRGGKGPPKRSRADELKYPA